MGFLKNLLSESNQVSTMRLMAFISLFAGIGVAYVSLFKGCSLDSSASTVALFVGTAFGGKVWQKYAEKK